MINIVNQCSINIKKITKDNCLGHIHKKTKISSPKKKKNQKRENRVIRGSLGLSKTTSFSNWGKNKILINTERVKHKKKIWGFNKRINQGRMRNYYKGSWTHKSNCLAGRLSFWTVIFTKKQKKNRSKHRQNWHRLNLLSSTNRNLL